MSIYSYICPKCEKVSDVEKPMADPHPNVCPLCGYKGVLGRVFAVPGITFRGSGFYHTDKRLDEITDPEYQLTEAEQVQYYDEKLRHGDDRKVRVFT
jgi:putative FmdB family regulatory protein